MLRYAALSDVGLVRENNEDSCYAGCPLGGLEENLFLVADGMGGHRGGSYASRFVAHKIPELLPGRKRKKGIRAALQESLERANRALYQISRDQEALQGMGSTLVMAWFDKKEWIILNVGDSRCYLFEEGRLQQITQDHSLVEEMARQGVLDRNDPLYQSNRHKITRAMGTEPYVEEDTFTIPARPGQRLLLCTDGLHGMVSDEAIARALEEEKDINRGAAGLLRMAREAGGQDNITVLLVEYLEENE